ncbi:unnamed protein product [Diatraea saccharalis]|uniref:PIG-P domain-containing protein n=1 Tax=Diatraea saccharalis TaxID=40085 RepID=A0A9N9WAV7_9NEOP|nr:unnamed protein product [Diatraea saccharalis]
MPEHTPAPTHARSLYGFFMYLFSKTILGIYCIWAFVPDEYLHYFNIYYYPQKYWSTAVPIQCLMALTLFVFIIYPSSNLILTPSIDSINTICDPYSRTTNKITITERHSVNCVCHELSKCKRKFYISSISPENTVPQLQDLNIKSVCRKLYLNKQIN